MYKDESMKRRGQDSNLQELSLGSFQDYCLAIRLPLRITAASEV